MTRSFRFLFPVFGLAAAFALSAQAQFLGNTAKRLHIGNVSVGGYGQFSTILVASPSVAVAPYLVGNAPNRTLAYNQQQYTTDSAGFLATFGIQPVKWAGVELNYGYTHYSEKYAYNVAAVSATQQATVPTDSHEFTAAYMLRPKFIPFQPFIGIGGGAIDFTPSNASNQWRGAGLLETGFNIKTRNPHLSFRLEGRSLYYRSPNYYQPVISTQSWRVTEEPTVSAFYSF